MLEAGGFDSYIEDERLVFKMADSDKSFRDGAVYKPMAIGDLSRDELDTELRKGIDSLNRGEFYSSDEVDAELAKEFGI